MYLRVGSVSDIQALVTPNKFGQFPEDFELISPAKASRMQMLEEQQAAKEAQTEARRNSNTTGEPQLAQLHTTVGWCSLQLHTVCIG